MAQPELRVTVLENAGDVRGSSFQTGAGWLGFLGSVEDAHIATILPGQIRGNHYHVRRREVIAVLYADAWQLAWDNGADTEVNLIQFAGSGAVILEADPLASHAIENTGAALLWIVGLSNGAWDEHAPDAYPRRLLPRTQP
jgi:hypothetical protein